MTTTNTPTTNAQTTIPLDPLPQPVGSTSRFLNREIAWLEFNRRVLHEAIDERTPLLERAAFLAIFTSNLDEYVQKRVGALKRQIQLDIAARTPDGLTPQEQLAAIREAVIPMLHAQAECYAKLVRPALADQGVHLLTWDQLTADERRCATAYFEKNLFPVLTPLAVDPGHPFPFMSNLSRSLGVMLRPQGEGSGRRVADNERQRALGDQAGLEFARVKIPSILPGWIRLETSDGNNERFIRLDQVIWHHLHRLFEGMEIIEVEPFRITRNADVERDEEDAEDLLDLIEQELRDRRFASVVRLEVDDDPCLPMNQFLIEEMGLQEDDVYQMPAELDYTDLWAIHGINRPDLKHEPWTPIVPPRLADNEADIFSVIRAGDVFVHHPYESFNASVERFIRSAASDPRVMAIKATLYRTSEDSTFIPELIKAAERGKQVVCLVELKARFDEERNVQLAQRLEKAGVHVVYGLVGYKTHTKTTLVVRNEPEGMRSYAHIGTGNYHSKTANLYTDLGLLTCRPELTQELVELFHFLTGRSAKSTFHHLLVAPINMRNRFEQMIDREIEHTAAWKRRGADPDDPARPRIVAKMNSLEDKKLCNRLYKASQAGVRVELNVRGFCCLRPGVPGLSENISVYSVIGRFLEHSRIYYFHNHPLNHSEQFTDNPYPGEFYIGSADWMYRNLNNRVECITPIHDHHARQRLAFILETARNDYRQAWDMHPDGSYIQRRPDKARPELAEGTHKTLMKLYRSEADTLRPATHERLILRQAPSH
ncbi:polyphosphate kinase 1 [Mucisphaera calidilacus]|uniref:Polyphosphate kinase n=1 Tax=Mucisphaera calidilacus TaxID=2527982 RepID=A0A518C109_9BACT|nr:polyphosphate kinase 1 [Mucisphaera calidilacus]QDU72874.1 Polyphosphate kinase [Mucisphaera calidilacus]